MLWWKAQTSSRWLAFPRSIQIIKIINIWKLPKDLTHIKRGGLCSSADLASCCLTDISSLTVQPPSPRYHKPKSRIHAPTLRFNPSHHLGSGEKNPQNPSPLSTLCMPTYPNVVPSHLRGTVCTQAKLPPGNLLLFPIPQCPWSQLPTCLLTDLLKSDGSTIIMYQLIN